MSERQPAWKEALKEPNAIGWIGLIVLVVVIGFGALYFGDSSSRNTSDPPRAGHAAR
jgi:hypothetical protein